MIRSLSATALLFPMLLLACSEAKFSGDAPSRATQDDPTPKPSPNPGETGLSCTLSPDSVKINTAALVAVASKENSPILYQTVINGGAKSESTLKYGGPDARGLYIKEDGTANEIQSGAAGTLVVELRKDKGQVEADATCQLVVTGETTVVTDPGKPKPPTCTDGSRKIGAEIAFLIDNSNSNAATDCPSDRLIGSQNGADLYECSGQTNREATVLAAYDVLHDVAAADANNALAHSRVAIGSFPTASDYVSGWKNESGGFLDVLSSSRDAVSNTMRFARRPLGMTPYNAALGGAKEIFAGSANDQRAKIAVLVTDGEPTDGAPDAVTSKAAELAAQGVQVITVFVTSGETRAARETKHISMLKKIDDTRLAQTSGRSHWYDAKYASFDAYVQSLLGGAGQSGVIRTISNKVIEVSDSSGLTNAFLTIIKSEAVKCEP